MRIVPVVVAAVVLTATLAYAVPPTKCKQVSVGTGSASQIGSADQARIALTWWNADATNPVYCDSVSSVTSSTGAQLKAGFGLSIDSCQGTSCGANHPLYCIATGSAVQVGYCENRGY